MLEIKQSGNKENRNNKKYSTDDTDEHYMIKRGFGDRLEQMIIKHFMQKC